MVLSEEERKERRRIANQKYRQSEKGKKKTNEANKRYQKTDKFKESRRKN